MLKEYAEGQILLIDKPTAWTSFDVVNKIRYALKRIKVGHAGTLDPLATGLLILCTGKFTKRLNEFSGLDKTYEGIITLGASTPSFDSETPFNNTFDTSGISAEAIRNAVKQLTGEIQQVPPIYSALKKDGQAAYISARKGEDIKMEPRTVTVKQFNIVKIEMPHVHFVVECSKGTYIRSLAHDLGAMLNNGGYLSSLRRTKIGNYSVADAWQLDSFIQHIKSETQHEASNSANEAE
jgi:tRNA pseudouridine55 synthase